MKIRAARERRKELRIARKSRTDIILHRKKRRLKYIAVLPSIVTMVNGACGFVALVFASRSTEFRWTFFSVRDFNMSSFSLAAYMLLLAMIADMLDGRVARLTRTTSSFGGQLDSLSDAISFGAAPAFIMLKLVESHMANLNFEHIRFSMLIGRGIFFSAIFYAMCAVVRLARFNVENEDDEAAHMNFAGLPSPAAAGIVVSTVIIHQQILPRVAVLPQEGFYTFEIITLVVFPVVTFFAGLLMVSRIRYPHLANQLLRGKKSLTSLLLLFAGVLLIVWNIQLAMVVGFCGYALFGVFRWLIVTLIKKIRPPEQVANN